MVVAELLQAAPSHGRGQGFETLRAHQIKSNRFNDLTDRSFWIFI